jgi:ATP-dependent DNA ligase
MADKRNLTEFKLYEREDIGNKNIHAFPKIIHDSANGQRSWQIFVRLIEQPSEFFDEHDWELDAENTVPLKKKYYKIGEKLPEDYVAQYWTESGLLSGKSTRYIPSYIEGPNNIGRSNERNAFQRALIKARAKYKQAMDSKTPEKSSATIEGEVLATGKVYYPMLAIGGNDIDKHIVYPTYVQPKLDGVRRLASIENGKVLFYSRRGREPPVHELVAASLAQLFDHLEYDEQLFLDGEFYQHGVSLQSINSAATKGELLTFHVFDSFFPSKTVDTKRLDATSVKDAKSRGKEPFVQRVPRLAEINRLIKKLGIKYVKVVTTKVVEDKDQLQEFYRDRIRRNYEGVIIRNFRGIYLTSFGVTGDRLRSKNVIKMKEVYTEEFRIVGFTTGEQGGNADAIVWIGETKKGKQFNVVQKGVSLAERKRQLRLAEEQFDELYQGKLMKVDFAGLSEDKIPLQAKATVIPFDDTI